MNGDMEESCARNGWYNQNDHRDVNAEGIKPRCMCYAVPRRHRGQQPNIEHRRIAVNRPSAPVK